MVSVLTVVDHGFLSWSDQNEIVICCFSVKLHKGVRAKTGWPGIRIMWMSTVACLTSKSKDWLARNQDNVEEYSGMSNE